MIGVEVKFGQDLTSKVEEMNVMHESILKRTSPKRDVKFPVRKLSQFCSTSQPRKGTFFFETKSSLLTVTLTRHYK